MGKGKTPGIANKETFQRINFLYQAAHQCLETSPHDVSLCRYYIHTLKTLAKRQVLRLHPDMRRTLCKMCSVLLLPGVTARVRTGKKQIKLTQVTCLECGASKRFPWKPDHQLWADTEEAWLAKT
ncbi:ribonuclease P protein subunit p21-like [Haliotis rufescens]|uniref:ribonuclease P protein subunit p21-like n=1 Tax=Haliotis rufescens TaxID=6454 RepID=UPI00201FAC3D|nr:ribonuclease P protein subunit p21-like [Haliotis rufescens]